ncbi:MAG: ATP-binding protein [Vicinamibacterales bacterium]
MGSRIDPVVDSRLLRAARRYFALASDRRTFLWVMDAELRPTGANAAWEEYTGQSREQYLESGWLEAIREDDRARCVREIEANVPREQPFGLELAIRRRDGVYRRYAIRAIPIRDEGGAVVEWIGTATDIEEHRELRERLVALTDGADSVLRPAGIDEVRRAICDLAGRVLPADAYGLWSFEPDTSVWHIVQSQALSKEFASQRVSGVEITFSAPLVADDLQGELLEPRAAAYRAEGIRSLISVPLPIEGVRRGSLVAYYREPHRTSEAELQIAVALGHLGAAALGNAEHRVRHARLYEEAKRANRGKDEFLALLSHELRTPLNAIMGWAQLLMSSPVAATQSPRRGLEIIKRNARHQAELVDGLLDVARVATDGLPLSRQTVDVAEAATSAVEAIRPVAVERGLAVQVAIETNGCRVFADPNRFQQILGNLLSNALKFTDKGGRVDVVVRQIDRSCEVEVADTGAGIEPEFLPHVFERFRQADSSTTRRHGGLGLGLWLVHELVRAHGGTVHVSSAGKEHGSSFVVRLPLVD